MRSEHSYLLDMLLAASEAVNFAEAATYSEFHDNRVVQLAILKSVEVVGEAAAHIDEVTREAYPEIPWHEIVGMRNHLVHGYFDVDLKVVWQTINLDFPKLIDQLERLILPEAEK